MTTGETIDPAGATRAARTLVMYRTRIASLLARAETAGQCEDSEIHFAVATLVDGLSYDLIQLYDELARGALGQSDRVTVLPALELIREVLRHAWRRPCLLSDILQKALESIPGSPA